MFTSKYKLDGIDNILNDIGYLDEMKGAGEDQEDKYTKKSGKKSKDFDGDGAVEDETDEYAGVKDRAIKKATGKTSECSECGKKSCDCEDTKKESVNISTVLDELSDEDIIFLSDDLIEEVVEEFFYETLNEGFEVDELETLLTEQLTFELRYLEEAKITVGHDSDEVEQPESSRTSKLAKIGSAIKKVASGAKKVAKKIGGAAGEVAGATVAGFRKASASSEQDDDDDSSSTGSQQSGTSASTGSRQSGTSATPKKVTQTGTQRPGILGRVGAALKSGLKKVVYGAGKIAGKVVKTAKAGYQDGASNSTPAAKPVTKKSKGKLDNLIAQVQKETIQSSKEKTIMETQDYRNLQEAYLDVYDELDEGKSSRPRYAGPERVSLGLTGSERRTEKRDAAAENMRGHTEGPGTVTKNPKKLLKQKAMGELRGSGKAEVEESYDQQLDEISIGMKRRAADASVDKVKKAGERFRSSTSVDVQPYLMKKKDKAEAQHLRLAKAAESYEQEEALDEGDNYDKNRQRAAQRAAARNDARKAGKTGVVPGVGYVTPRPERETYRDAAGVERHKTGGKMPKKDVTENLDEACWKGYKAIGMKTKGGKQVPNCVPKEEYVDLERDMLEEGYTFDQILEVISAYEDGLEVIFEENGVVIDNDVDYIEEDVEFLSDVEMIADWLYAEGVIEDEDQFFGLMEDMSEEEIEELYSTVFEATAMAKRGLNEPEIRNKIAKETGGGSFADKATKLADRETYGNKEMKAGRENLARKQRGDFRNTTSSKPGLQGYGHKATTPEAKAKQSARGAQRGVLTPNEKKSLGREGYEMLGNSLEEGGLEVRNYSWKEVMESQGNKRREDFDKWYSSNAR